jgi:hypothetical protein
MTMLRNQIGLGRLWTSYAGGGLGSLDLGTGQTEVRFTLLGDANLAGIVNVADLGNLATNFGRTDALWINGDFDYNNNNNVNVADLGDVATNFGQSLGFTSNTPTAAASPSAPPAVNVAASVFTAPGAVTPLPPQSSEDILEWIRWRQLGRRFHFYKSYSSS